jgi:hypothetical protein
MFMYHWSVGLARVYALQALEDEIRRRHGIPRPAPRRWFRRALTRAVRSAGRLVSALGGRPGASPEPRPLGCG